MGRDSERNLRRHDHVFRVLLSTAGKDRRRSERKHNQPIEFCIHPNGLAVVHQLHGDGGPLFYTGPAIRAVPDFCFWRDIEQDIRELYARCVECTKATSRSTRSYCCDRGTDNPYYTLRIGWGNYAMATL